MKNTPDFYINKGRSIVCNFQHLRYLLVQVIQTVFSVLLCNLRGVTLDEDQIKKQTVGTLIKQIRPVRQNKHDLVGCCLQCLNSSSKTYTTTYFLYM